MKVGILTLPLHTNYGGILQAYALQTVLERMGHEVCLIEKHQQPLRLPYWKVPFSYSKRILKNLTGYKFPILYEQKRNREIPIERQNTNKFINRYIKRIFVDEFANIKETDFDAIIVGSDQIWRPMYFPQIENAYLDFVHSRNIIRIAYAASFGTGEWEYTQEQTEHCKELIKKFNAISVRENSGVSLCHKYLGVNAEYVLDPTMLLPKEYYIRLFKKVNTPKSKGNLLGYILDETPEKTSLISKVAKKKGLVPFRVNSKVGDIVAPLEERIQPSVEQWLRGFYDAEFVITDSFHACVFSILFNKPFLVVGNAERGLSRFTSLLEMFELQQRILPGFFEDMNFYEIDWNPVNSALKGMISSSMIFLRNNLNS